jgi:hypothetical protein
MLSAALQEKSPHHLRAIFKEAIGEGTVQGRRSKALGRIPANRQK